MKSKRRSLCISAIFLTIFVLWTVAVRHVDVQAIGPNGSAVGFASMNRAFHRLTGFHPSLYIITDWLGVIPVAVCVGFALLGVYQWSVRKKLFMVDRDLIYLGCFYFVVLAAYLFFEIFVINYRPVLIQGISEASYPSSTTLLVMCVIPTAILQFQKRIKHMVLRRCITVAMTTFIIFMVVGRLLCGVHWLSDVIGGAFLSAGLVALYDAIL